MAEFTNNEHFRSTIQIVPCDSPSDTDSDPTKKLSQGSGDGLRIDRDTLRDIWANNSRRSTANLSASIVGLPPATDAASSSLNHSYIRAMRIQSATAYSFHGPPNTSCTSIAQFSDSRTSTNTFSAEETPSSGASSRTNDGSDESSTDTSSAATGSAASKEEPRKQMITSFFGEKKRPTLKLVDMDKAFDFSKNH